MKADRTKDLNSYWYIVNNIYTVSLSLRNFYNNNESTMENIPNTLLNQIDENLNKKSVIPSLNSKIKKIWAGLLLVLALEGCGSRDPQTVRNNTSTMLSRIDERLKAISKQNLPDDSCSFLKLRQSEYVKLQAQLDEQKSNNKDTLDLIYSHTNKLHYVVMGSNYYASIAFLKSQGNNEAINDIIKSEGLCNYRDNTKN